MLLRIQILSHPPRSTDLQIHRWRSNISSNPRSISKRNTVFVTSSTNRGTFASTQDLWTSSKNLLLITYDERSLRDSRSVCELCTKRNKVKTEETSIAVPCDMLFKICCNGESRPRPRTFQGNQYVLVIEDCYFKLSKENPILKSLSSHVANLFFDYGIVPFGIFTYFRTDKRPQFLCKFFHSFSRKLKINWFLVRCLSTTSKYHTNHKLMNKRNSATNLFSLTLDISMWNVNAIGTCSCNLIHTSTIHR